MATNITSGPLNMLLYLVVIVVMVAQKFWGGVHPYLHMTLDVLAVLYVGCFLSLKFFTLVKSSDVSLQQRPLTFQESWRYPLYATALLMGAFLALQNFGRAFVNSFLSIYFAYIGTNAIKCWLDDLLDEVIYMRALKALSAPLLAKLRIKLSRYDIVVYTLSATVMILFVLTRDWLFNNICAIAFCLYSLKNVCVGRFGTAFTMLGFFMIYDVVFVYSTSIMQTLATNIDVPIKLVFTIPGDTKHCAILGLGDILVPGILISHCLRFDVFQYFKKRLAAGDVTLKEAFPASSWEFSKPYFWAGMAGYAVGFATAMIATIVTGKSQPALLYLVPSVCLSIFTVAAVRGERAKVLSFDEAAEAKLMAEESKENRIAREKNTGK